MRAPLMIPGVALALMPYSTRHAPAVAIEPRGVLFFSGTDPLMALFGAENLLS